MTLKLYIARRFFAMVFVTFLICGGLIFMIDFVELLRQAGKGGKGIGVGLLVQLTLLRLPAYSEILLTFAVLVGTMTALLTLSRKSELAVMRAGGMSVWGLLWPCLGVAFVLGVLSTTVYNPLAAKARATAEAMHAVAFGKTSDFLTQSSGLPWLRQNGVDGPSVIAASAVSENGLRLISVQLFQYDRDNKFVARIAAKSARLFDGYWELKSGLITRPGGVEQPFDSYIVSTYLSPARVTDALGSVISLSFWDLPGLIEVVEKAGLSAASYQVQYQLLLARPVLLVTMVLLAATVSLRSFRSGGVQTMVMVGMIGGIGFFLMAEVSRQVGAAGLIAPWLAVWAPVLTACLVSLTVLLHQEDG